MPEPNGNLPPAASPGRSSKSISRRSRIGPAGTYPEGGTPVKASLPQRLTLFPEHELGDGRQLHVGRALVDLADLGVAPVLFDGIVLGESVSAVDFDGE